MDLNDIVDNVLGRPTQDSGRLNALANYCVLAFDSIGLSGIRGGDAGEVGIRGIARNKDWDLAYVFAGKPRMLISLKSILKNMPGTIPNRLDDLMGESANVQQFSPEIVTGYVIIMDEAANTIRRDGTTWIDFMHTALRKLSIRQAPLWNQGLIEGVWVIRIDSREPSGSRVVDFDRTIADGAKFFQDLLTELLLREPAIKGATTRTSLFQNPR
jgi:hypothetical protein